MKRTKTKKDDRHKAASRRYSFSVVIEKDEDGYFATCPTLPGCATQGDTYEQALEHIEEAIHLYVEDLLAEGEPVPTADRVSVTTLEVEL